MKIKVNKSYPLVSIFCMCKNRRNTIRRCIDSILAQDYPNIEIIVQDGASTDGTLEILQGYGDKIELVSEPDSSPDDASARAFARIKGEFFGSCLSDEELLPNAVSWAVENLQKHPDVAAIYGDHFVTDLDGNITGEVHPRQWDLESYFCSEWTPPFCASFFRTLCFKTLGRDEYSGADEFNFWISLGSRYPIRYVPGFVAKYAAHSDQLSLLVNKRERRIADRKRVIERLCNDPRTPDHIRSLRDKALAGLACWSVESYCQLGDWNLARAYALEAFEKAPKTDRIRKIAERFYRHGMDLYQKGDLEPALESFNLLIECGVVGAELEQAREAILQKLSPPSQIATTAVESERDHPQIITRKALTTHTHQSEPHPANDIPVIVVCYNRPRHTLHVLEALREQNIQNIHIFSDAPKSPEDAQAVQLTRRLVHSIDWTKPKIVERKENFGLARNIVNAVDSVFERYERLILLEDDCIPQRHFFDFMRSCLDKYENDPQVFGISGYTVPIPDDILRQYPYDLYFCPRIGSWGWATWKSAWRHRENDLQRLVTAAVEHNIDLTQAGTDIPTSLERFMKGQLKDVWTLNWVLTVYLNHGVYIYPTHSHIKNIGMDGTGLHCDKTDRYETPACDAAPTRYPEEVFIDEQVLRNFKRYYEASPAEFEASVRFLKSFRPKTAPKKKSLKVVHISAQDFGGAGTAAYRLHKGLELAGIDSSMVVLNKKSNDPKVKVVPGSYSGEYNPMWLKQYERWQETLHRYPQRRSGAVFTDAVSDVNLESIEEIQQADIINLHWVAGLMDFSSMPRALKGKPIVWTIHDMNPFTGGCHYAGECDHYQTSCLMCPQLGSNETNTFVPQIWKQKFEAYQNLPIHVVSPTRWLRQCAAGSALFRRCPVTRIANGFPLDVFKPYPKKEVRKALNIPETANVLLFGACSVTDERKGFDYLLKALEHPSLANEQKNLVLALFGDLPKHTKITSKYPVFSYGSIEKENHLAMLYSIADAYLIPSIEDNLPNTAIEALACGVPVIGFRIGGIPDIVEHMKTGYLAEPKDIEGLVKGIQWIFAPSTMSADLAKQCRQKAINDYSMATQAEAYISLYNGILESESLPAEASHTHTERPTQKDEAITINSHSQSDTTSPDMTLTEEKVPTEVDVSIVVATRDRGKLLDDMLTSLKEAAEGISYEVIVIEGGSTDNTHDVLRKHGITQVYNESEHMGPGRHSWSEWYNFGFSKARGTWAMHASDDIVFEKGSVTQAVHLLKSQKSPSVAGGVFFYKEVVPEYPGWEKQGICFALGHKLLMNFGLIRLDVFRELGGYDEGYIFRCPDIDLSFKVYESGRQLIPLADCLLIHNNVMDELKQKNIEVAETDYQYLLRKWKHFVPTKLDLPKRLFWEPKYAAAFTMPAELENVDEGIEHLWHGLACLQIDQPQEAIRWFSKALDSSNKHWTMLWLSAEALHRMGFHEQAQKTADFVARINPGCVEIQPLLNRVKPNNLQAPTDMNLNTASGPAIHTPRSHFVIEVKYGGIGDHLFYSHLPRIAKQSGQYDRVFVSSHSEFRNPEYRKLVWECNPYVDGFCDENGDYPIFDSVEEGMNILDKIMVLRGLDDGKRFHEPELYFKGQSRQDLFDAVVYDPNFVSYVGDISSEEIESFLRDNHIRATHQMALWEKHYELDHNLAILQTNTLEEFCRVILSCRQLLCLSSGTATLASALGKPATVFYGNGQKPMFHHSRLHRYVNCSARQTSILGSGTRIPSQETKTPMSTRLA